MTKSEQITIAKLEFLKGNDDFKNSLRRIFPDIDFDKREYSEGDLLNLNMSAEISNISNDDEFCYELTFSGILDGVYEDDREKIWVTEEFVKKYLKK